MHDITAVENNQDIASIYKKRFPKDEVIVTDAYTYLEENYDKFDFIWASPPCPTHSKLVCCRPKGKKKLPDMRLYSIIIFLQQFFYNYWVVENVQSYYQPLIPAITIGRHYIWTNCISIKPKKYLRKYTFIDSNIENLKEEYNINDIIIYKGYEERKMLRNMVHPEMGKYILDCVLNKKQKSLMEYTTINP